MFGIGRRSEMKSVQSRTQSCVRDIQNYLEDIKNTLNMTISIAHESQLPENNIINQKEYLYQDIESAKIYFEQIKAKLNVEGLEIAREIAIEDLKIGISQCEEMVYSLKNMNIPNTDNVEDYFQQYEENYKIAMSGAALAAGVGALGIGGAAAATSLTVAGLSTVGIVGTSLVGAGSLLSGIGAIAAGPVGWIVGGIGLLGYFASAPSKEEISEAREQLAEFQEKRAEIYNVYLETMATKAKAEGVIRLSKNFTIIRKDLSKVFKEKRKIMEKLIEEDLSENREKLYRILKVKTNEDLNKLLTFLYCSFKDKKKFFCFKRKKTIWNMIESAENIKIAFDLINKYLRVPKEFKKINENISKILENTDLKEIVIMEIFDKKDSYTLFEDKLKMYMDNNIEKNLKITSPKAKKAIKEVIDMMKLFKNIIISPMINVEATQFNYIEGMNNNQIYQ